MTDTATTALFIQLSAEVLEDLHTGSGTGGGDIDALVQRDRNGRPVIRASHFKGLLREAGEELIALGTLAAAELDELLGTEGTGRGALRLTSLRLPEGDAGRTLIWGSTQRVENGRAPRPDTLRFIEHVAAGARFKAQLRLADTRLQPLLERLLNRIDRIGGARNRGGGLVRLDWRAQPPTASIPTPLAAAGGLSVRFVLRNLEPLCLPATGYPGNLIKSHSFIRGQTLRGAFVAWAIHNGQADRTELFKQVSVGDALPLPEGCGGAEQVIPIPLSILTDKPKGGDPALPWWIGGGASSPVFDALGEVPEAEEKRKRPGAHEYLCRTKDVPYWQRYTPSMQVRLRNATPKRSSTEDTRLFSLEEIAEDTCFQAELRCADAQTLEDFRAAFAPLLAGTDWLGIGRGGQPVGIESVDIAPPPTLPLSLGDDWTLTLISDAIVRGERLGFLDNLSRERLCRLAGIPLGDGWEIATDAVETETLHGFNAVTGLTRAPASALRRGSCWRVRGPGSAELARALFQIGTIGERAGEGCGRFLIGLQPIDSGEIGKPPGKQEAPKPNRHEELLVQARKLADQLKGNGPSLSQLQWLRSQASAVRTEAQLQALLDEIEQAPTRRPQGGKPWAKETFPLPALKDALKQCSNLTEQRQLIAYLVQWRVPKAKEARS
ncbi:MULTISPECIES: RAMP superfamily CRISPR-associated protein [unclassified Thiocapsa]|uniref:RAMP superfamily CRISPR-associated protein n=1 Tax=unclassified Thiocapsa TaxID=2641286 RepID=UPI0035AFA1A4